MNEKGGNDSDVLSRMNKSSGPLCVAEACVEIHCYIFENQNKAL